MNSFLSAASAALLLLHPASAFTAPQNARSGATALRMAADGNEPTRRAFFRDAASVVGAAALLQSPLAFPEPANAIGGGLKKVNARLAAYGLPLMKSIPDGFSPLLEIYGKGANRSPLLVNFAHPLDWVVTLPNLDVNGEDGTIQAGEYGKGDTATLFVYNEPGKVSDIGEKPKAFFEDVLQKAISQKGSSIYQNFKVTAVNPVKGEYGDQTYVLVDFKYELITGAGFEVDRRAVASVTSQGNSVQAFWCASTRQRYKKLEPNLRAIAQSFRCYSDGLDLVAPTKEDDFLS